MILDTAQSTIRYMDRNRRKPKKVTFWGVLDRQSQVYGLKIPARFARGCTSLIYFEEKIKCVTGLGAILD